MAAITPSSSVMAPSCTQHFEHLVSGLHELDDGGRRPATDLRIDRGRGLEEAIKLLEALLRVFVGRLVLLRFRNALTQDVHRRVELPLFPLVHHDAEHLPNVLEALEVIALIALY